MQIGLALFALGLLALAVPAAGQGSNPRVALDTSMGQIVVELDPAKAPKSVENFLAYVESGFFDGTIFHRVIPGFMIQGGGFTADMDRKPTRAPIENEASNGLSNGRGTLAMARTSDPNSATAQFFINTVDNARNLDPAPGSAGYAVFGKVVEGMDVVDQISGVRTTRKSMMADVPVEPVVIEKASVVGDS
jgi:peptidyl-prolyl cis-trans isomerase A (cyclophilin A)